jgi:hypothetical protein
LFGYPYVSARFPIAALIARRKGELDISTAEIVRRAGLKSINGGLRRLDDLCHGGLTDKTKFLRDGIPVALELPPDQVTEAVEAIEQQLAEAERARTEEKERRYRERFKLHALWVTENEVPRPLFIAAMVGWRSFCASIST